MKKSESGKDTLGYRYLSWELCEVLRHNRDMFVV